MTAEEYLAARRAAGHRLHLHDGVWWESVRRGYCKPAILYEEVDPQRQAPAFWHAMLGCVHRVPPGRPASGHWHSLIMRREQIARVALETMEQKRRNLIRKGLRLTRVVKITDLNPYRTDLTEVAISTAIRNQRGHPPAYYREKGDEWWAGILRGSAYTEFWGALHEGRLIAYLAVQMAGHRAIIDGAKSMTEFLHANPNDALVFTFLESCRDRGTIAEIFYGGWSTDKPSLNHFKESFGFRGEKIPFLRRICGGRINWRAGRQKAGA